MTAPRRIDALDVSVADLEAAPASQAHDFEDPAIEDAFAHLAIDHPDAVRACRRPEVAR